jgi:hypothetical protein
VDVLAAAEPIAYSSGIGGRTTYIGTDGKLYVENELTGLGGVSIATVPLNTPTIIGTRIDATRGETYINSSVTT